MSELLSQNHGYFHNGGIRLHYLAWGNPKHPPIICLHGGAHSAAVWSDFGRRMAPRRHVVALDQRGHGESDWSSDRRYTRDDFVNDIRVLLDQLGRASAALVAHSFGGNIALRFASQNPEKVQRLVLVDVGPGGANFSPRQAAEVEQPPTRRSAEDFVDEAMRRNPRRGRAYFERSLLPNLKQTADGNWTWKHDPSYRMVSLEHFSPEAQAENWRQFAALLMPVLLIRGELSPILSLAAAQRLKKTLPTLKIVTIPQTGHNVHIEEPERFAAAVAPFLTEST